MSGQVINRGRFTWQVKVPLGKVAGTRKYFTKTIKGTKADAQRFLTKKLRERDTGTLVEHSRETVREYLNGWLSDVADVRVSRRTGRDYREYANRYIIPALGDLRLSSLVSSQIQSLYAGMSAKGLSPRTVRFTHAVLRMALDTAVRTNVLTRNPALTTTLPKAIRREMHALSPEEVRKFIAAARDDHWEAFWLILVALGLRPGEAAGLKWTDVEVDRLSIQRSLTPGYRGTWSVREPKTARSRRVVVMPPIVLTALTSHKCRQAKEKIAAGDSYQSHGFVFAMPDGSPVHPEALAKGPFSRLLRRAGVPVVRLYDLRHTSATLGLAIGENVKVISERLGHSSTTLTMDVYSHVLPGMQEDAAQRMERILAAEA